ncbi:MAG: glycerate kinase, partial [Saprospiraceae bacterium]|nr:glycerate kinase [Saprospiraceae bacterium]
MKILLAPDSFKGSLSSLRVAQIMKSAIVEVMPDANVTLFPLADGGEGSLEALHEACGGTKVSVDSVDPLGRSFQGHYLLGPDGTALVELAVSSGLTILKDLDRDPGKTSSLGTGLEVLHAIESGAHSIILCVGGSATNDAGLGIAHALGFRFLDAAGNSLQPVGANLSKITGIRKPHLPKVTWKILCDVDNPFYGPAGAVHTYAAQKGASREDVTMLESGMRHFAS